MGFHRGVSPIVATLLLILVSIGASALVYMLVSGYLTGNVATAKVGNTQIVIDALSCLSSRCDVYVRNVGTEDIPEGTWTLSVYVGDSLVDVATTSKSLKAGGMDKLTFNFSVGLEPGTYKLKLTTPTGSFATVQVKVI